MIFIQLADITPDLADRVGKMLIFDNHLKTGKFQGKWEAGRLTEGFRNVLFQKQKQEWVYNSEYHNLLLVYENAYRDWYIPHDRDQKIYDRK